MSVGSNVDWFHWLQLGSCHLYQKDTAVWLFIEFPGVTKWKPRSCVIASFLGAVPRVLPKLSVFSPAKQGFRAISLCAPPKVEIVSMKTSSKLISSKLISLLGNPVPPETRQNRHRQWLQKSAAHDQAYLTTYLMCPIAPFMYA